ncbi:hypothetical protein [Novosphingobium sp. MBES04]|nr:hypothetical protein [Novosphingobium sp. MBES04]GAM06363.1 hypothetical protein MBENS4_3360 [Novosphingobium sp. MBES04]
MSRRLLPNISVAGWGGPGENIDQVYAGHSLVVEWGPFILEICMGRAK